MKGAREFPEVECPRCADEDCVDLDGTPCTLDEVEQVSNPSGNTTWHDGWRARCYCCNLRFAVDLDGDVR